MRRILIVTGVLGGGTAVTFAAAALAATMLPSGNLVYGQQPEFWARPMPMPGLVVPERGPLVDPGWDLVAPEPVDQEVPVALPAG